MVTKGIVEEIINIYQAKVRLPVYDGFADTKNATPSDELTIASICNIPNIYNTIAVGDIVYMAFEDNDLGNPVILGQLYKEEMNTLADIKLNSANINQLTINKNVSLPQNTSIGSISSKEIAALSGIKDNIQNQIDINLPAITFAESERQKSKNLLEVNNGLDTTKQGLHVQINNNIITVDGAATSNTAINIATFNPKIYAGKTYTFSFKDYSNLSNFEIAVTGIRNDGTKKYNMFNLLFSAPINTITPDVDYTLNIEVYSLANKTVSGTFKLLLEEGSVATDYQPYNGAIVHEKSIADVEHIELLYDRSSSDSNINKGKTSGIMFSGDGTNNVSLETSSTSKYKGFNVYVFAVNQILKVYLSVDKVDTGVIMRTSFAGQNEAVGDSNILYGHLRYVYGNLYPVDIRETFSSGERIYQNNSSYYVSKIEGVY